MKKLTQKERVLQYLQNHKYITALDGYKKMNPPITQIHTVIHKLREDGYDIDCHEVKNKNTKTYFGRWSLNG